MAIYVTANMQLGRPSAIKKYSRDYPNVDEMTKKMIDKWNEVVTKDDVVYHIGNFAWDPKTAQEALLRLNGQIYFIMGEHDQALETLETKGMLRARNQITDDIVELKDQGVILSYWPMKVWPNKSKKYYSVIGYPLKKYKSDPKERVINAATDFWSNKPQDLVKLVEIFADF